ncbi:MAG: NAD-dependent protein deacylase [Rhodocyclaceae bacterium]|nr:NAD-dependent protein deacylase [Rhodocyclaceae bacterium]
MDADHIMRAVGLRLAQAERVLFITGAGISADSGLPTYRGVGGIYDGVATADGIDIEEALSGPMFQVRPVVTWKYLAQIEAACRGARPNAAHYAIAELERHKPGVFTLTQNVDGLHSAAGVENLVEIHGCLKRLACTVCGWRTELETYAGLALPPQCPECSGLVRPQVVLFGENLPMDQLERLYAALDEGFDMVFTIGTSALFPYIVQPVLWARSQGIPTVEINPGTTELSTIVDYRVQARAALAMPAILAAAGLHGRRN